MKILVLDIETTGLTPECDMICEIGICLLNLKNGNIIPILDQICQEQNKEFDEYSWIFQNSDLTIKQVIESPYLIDFKTELQDILNLKHPITAYNQQFDFSFLEHRGFQIKNKFWDPMFKLKNIMKIPHFYYGYKFPSVQEAWNFFFKGNYIEKHRALDDAIHEAKIIYETNKYLKKNFFPRNHSLFLRRYFDISMNGIDYYNTHNVGFEFKETWSPFNINKFFRVPFWQVENADYFVFCENSSNFYIVESQEIHNRYNFENKTKKAHIRLNSVIEMTLFHTKKIEKLKELIEMIKE